MELKPELFDDVAAAFRHESLWGLLKRWGAFRAMGFPRLSAWIQDLAVRHVEHPLGRFVAARLFDLFLGGESLEGCRGVIDHLRRYRADAILDFLVEGGHDEDARDQALRELLATVEFAHRERVPFVACKPSGLMDLEVLGKLQAGTPLGEAETRRRDAAFGRLRTLARRAGEFEVDLFVDAEWVYMQDPVDSFMVELMRAENRKGPRIFTTLQMYRRDRLDFLARMLAQSASEGWWFACKLVRGAYLDFERANNPVDPLYPTIEATHQAYDRAVAMCLDALDHCAVVVASHNQASVLGALRGMQARGVPFHDRRVAVAQLLGMSDPLTYLTAGLGCGAYKYVPYGPLDEAVPYLVRRAQENSSVTKDSARELDSVQRELLRRLGLGCCAG